MCSTSIIIFVVVILLPFSSHAKITVHLVPHTHDDLGWLKTVEQYQYGLNNSIQSANVNIVISSVVGGLLLNPERRFTYVEMGFFSRWWAEQPAPTRAAVRTLVAEGRLQFANGGWSMHDEAAAHVLDMIDQTTLGHRWLQRELGVVPRVGWQADAFGHSATQAAILTARAGLIATYFARVDYQDYRHRAGTGRRQFWWKPSPSLPHLRVFAEINLRETYCTPPDFSWDILNYWPDSNDTTCSKTIVDDNKSECYNVPLILKRFKAEVRRNINATRGKHIMWTMGCDFTYFSSALWYENMDKLIKLVNDDGEFSVRYSTPYEYTLAKLKEAEEGLLYDTKRDDFFPYASAPHQFWTGYFASRPTLKRIIRKLSGYWLAARQVEFFAAIPSGEVPLISDALGIAQHHDAVTGTAKQHVTFDYIKRLINGYEDDMVNRLRRAFASEPFAISNVQHCLLSNVSVCPATAVGFAKRDDVITVIVWNPNAHPVANSLVKIPVPISNVLVTGDGIRKYSVFDSPVEVSDYSNRNADRLPYTLAINLQLKRFAVLKVVREPVFSFSASGIFPLSAKAQSIRSITEISNDDLLLTFSDNGLLERVTVRKTGQTVKVVQDWCYYKSNSGDIVDRMSGGAYIMRPVTNGTCDPITNSPVNIRLVDSTIGIVEQHFGNGLVQRMTLRGDVVDLEFTSFGIPIDDGFGRELVVRFRTSVENRDTFYTDSNGREMQKRRINYRNDFPFVQTESVAGNYYPVTSLIFINDTNTQFSVFPDASMGGASLQSGEVLLTVHRRLLRDDDKGVGEPLNETEFITSYKGCVYSRLNCGRHYGAPLHVRGTLSFAVTKSGPTAMRRVREQQDEKYYEPLVLYSSASSSSPFSLSSLKKRMNLKIDFGTALPPSLQILTMQLFDNQTLLLRLGHRYAVGEDPERSVDVKVELLALIAKVPWCTVSSVDEVSLTTVEVVKTDVKTVTISPMDIRTFVYHLKSLK
ncbi:lysosomal alpha-mannosidase precursor [Trypanosoma theileri]|uniref:Alpha-mannosidase n=1 Tax=Trypanosoma theileri TaxID=67003 RepID=A0A1X0P8T0_9TRYP|nr:lysosomal alpha-mannosidase precursor [Trypanosoma theileri]ORC93241.1 lysosomal alpha-mannosidase precursor [Trypanosoma theileri]